jgi:hypothetical protein
MGPPLLIDPAVWAAAGIGIGGFLFYRGFGLLRRKRLILNTPRSTVRAAAIGLVEVSGKAVGPYTLISPLSALNCYFYRAVAWQNQARHWTKAAEETLYAPFFLDDGTGQLLVDPSGAEMDIPAPFSHEYDSSGLSGEIMSDYIAHFLHRHGISNDSGLKLEEQCILPGDVLFVLGTLQENPRAEASVKAALPPPHFTPSFVSEAAADLQRRGALERLDPAAQQTLLTQAEAASSFDLQPGVVLAKGPARDPFFISWCSEREVVLATAWKAFLYLWVGPAVVLACLWFLVGKSIPR